MDQASSLRKMVKQKAGARGKTSLAASAFKGNRMMVPRVIAVTSGKGGVGKTNIVANLAVAFSKLGQNVLILDADLGLANIDIIFGVRPEFNIGHVVNGEKNLADIMVRSCPISALFLPVQAWRISPCSPKARNCIC